MLFENNQSEVLLALQKCGYSEKKIAGMSPKEAFIEYCKWNGLPICGEKLWDQVMLLSGNAVEVPALEPIAPRDCGEPILSETSRARLVNVIGHAYGGAIDLENLMRCGYVSIKEMGDSELIELASSQVPPDDLRGLVEAFRSCVYAKPLLCVTRRPNSRVPTLEQR